MPASKDSNIKCFACGILIGKDHDDEKPFYLGDKPLCHIHYAEAQFKKHIVLQDFSSINSFKVLFENGQTGYIKKH